MPHTNFGSPIPDTSQSARIAAVFNAFRVVYRSIVDNTVDSDERKQSLIRLEEAYDWAEKSICRESPDKTDWQEAVVASER